MLRQFHIYEIYYNDAAEIAQFKLARNLFSGFDVGLKDRLLQISLPHEFSGIDIDRDEALRLVEYQISTAIQVDNSIKYLIYMLFDIEPFEQGDIPPVQSDPRPQ